MAAIAAIAPQSTRSGTNFSDTSPKSAIPIGLSTLGAVSDVRTVSWRPASTHRSRAGSGKDPQHPPPGRGDGASGRDQEQAGDHEDESGDPEPLAVPRDERQSAAAEVRDGRRCREARHPDHAGHAEEPADGVPGSQCDDQGADEDPEGEHCREDVERPLHRTERHGRRRDEHHRDRSCDRGRTGPHCWTSRRSQTETWAGCIVSRATPERSRVERVDLDLLAEARAEGSQRPLAVVAAAIEAAVDECLHARSHGEEERRHDERRRCYRKIRAAREGREERLPDEHEPDVGGTEHDVRALRRRASSR